MPKNGWPNNAFILNIYKEGYEFREVLIPSNFDLKKIFEIKLKKASSIKFTNSIKPPYYVSVGLLNSNGVLIQKPINYSDEYFKILYDDFATGIATFSNLSSGTYYVGYFYNNSTKLIAKQGPIILGEEESLSIEGTIKITE